MNSIYSNADPALLKLFEQAGHLRKVLCVPLDYAKRTHTVLFCNGVGDLLKKAFSVPNSEEGATKLLQEVAATCNHRSIESKHVFFGGEDTPSYAENFTALLRQKGYLVARVNAFDAKTQRENLQASTDKLDLHSIAHCLLKGRARVLAKKPDLHQQMRLLVRERDFLVRSLTRLQNRLHPHVDRLFPGFLDPIRSGIHPYGPACLWLLEKRFSAPQVAARDFQQLVTGLQKNRVRKPREVAIALQAFAGQVLPPAKEWVGPCQIALQELIPLARLVKTSLTQLEVHIAALLLQSPAARLTTVPGIGLNLASGIGAELGSLSHVLPLDKICSYAGLIPSIQQTGGPEKESRALRTFPHCNKHLKYYLLRAGDRMAIVPGTDAAQLRQRCEQKGQHALRVLGKSTAAVVRALLVGERAYLPQRLYHPSSCRIERGHYYQQYWPQLLAKWKIRAPLQEVFHPTQPLGAWRKMAQEAYGISLPLPGSAQPSINQPKEQSNDPENATLQEDDELI